MRKQKGFTIIELIVVIAIIAVLAAVVAVNVMSYIAKAKSAAILANMDALPVVATAYYEENETYGSFCESDDVIKIYDAVGAINDCENYEAFALECVDKASTIGTAGGRCEKDKWIAFTFLIDDNVYCIESDGTKIIIPGVKNFCKWFYSDVVECSCLSKPL